MNESVLARIESSQGWRQNRIEIIECDPEKVVVKGQRPPRNALSGWALKLWSTVARMPLLRGAPAMTGKQVQETEVRRLQELAAAGIWVPQILHQGDGYFAMEYLHGSNLSQMLERNPTSNLALWRQGLELILAAHASNQYFSQAYARNFIVLDQGLAAVDFEEDPLLVMPLEDAQVRDWLLYLQSTIWLLAPGTRRQQLDQWIEVVQMENPRVTALLLRATRQLSWLRHLPDKRRPWGRDIISAQGAASFLHAWRDSKSVPVT